MGWEGMGIEYMGMGGMRVLKAIPAHLYPQEDPLATRCSQEGTFSGQRVMDDPPRGPACPKVQSGAFSGQRAMDDPQLDPLAPKVQSEGSHWWSESDR